MAGLVSLDSDRAMERLVDLLASIPATQVSDFSVELTLQAVAAAVDSAHYWQPPDENDLVYARPAVRAALLPIARALTESPHTHDWSEGVDLGRQHVVRYQLDDDKNPNRRPSNAVIDLDIWRARAMEQELRAQRTRPLDPAAPYSGSWWSSPVFTGALQTTVAIDGARNMRLGLVEDAFDWHRLLIWRVAIGGAPRIFEITGPMKWADLVTSYPLAVTASRRHDWYRATGEVHDWSIPDWAAVAADYDAVHLTMWGYLTTPGMAIPAAGGATVLAGWNPDTTYWLRPELVSYKEEPSHWLQVDERWLPQ